LVFEIHGGIIVAYTSWTTEIVTRLKTGSIPTVVVYGDGDDHPEIPYVVVKQEASGISGYNRVAFYVHGWKGEKDVIEGYAVKELTALLKAPFVIEEGRMTLRDTKEFLPDLAVSDDGTISCRRSFLLPCLLTEED
jgi:hypothetical protein